MEKKLVKRAQAAFNQGKYEIAKELYQNAAKQYGKNLFDINIRLCEKTLKTGEGKENLGVKDEVGNIEIKQMNEENASLRHQLREKDANINERFEELAILTRMLEERENSASN